MPLRRCFLLWMLTLCSLCWAGTSSSLRAQDYLQTARAFMQSPAALGMGGTGAAFSVPELVYFYNPAHLARLPKGGGYATGLGLRTAGSTNLRRHYAFYRDELQPAFDAGFSTLDAARQDEIYDRAWVLGRRRTLLTGDVVLPSGLFNLGGVGTGLGLFAHSLARYRVTDGGAGTPVLHATGQADLIAMLPLALDLSFLGLDRLSVGAAGKYTKRYLTLKSKPLDGFDEDEDAYLLSGSSFGLDLGLLYDFKLEKLPGRLTAGAALYDAFATDFDYGFAWNLTLRAPDDEAVIQEEIAMAQERPLYSSYRVGLAYTLPSDGWVDETGVALDYVGYRHLFFRQTVWTRLRLGLQARVAGPLRLRAGLRQGYPSIGAGLRFSSLKINYAFYGTEEGRLPGQAPRWHHAMQIAIGAF